MAVSKSDYPWIAVMGIVVIFVAIELIKDSATKRKILNRNTNQEVVHAPYVPVKKSRPPILDITNAHSYSSPHRSTTDGVFTELGYFRDGWDYISENPLDSMNSKWVKRLQALQAKDMPAIRKSFAENSDRLLWEFDIEVTASGAGNRTITFIGGEFITNAKKKEYYEKFKDKLRLLRYKRLIFKWYKGQDEYTYYDLNPEKDTDRIWLSGF